MNFTHLWDITASLLLVELKSFDFKQKLLANVSAEEYYEL